MIAASNLLEKLDPALLRPGRFDRQIFVSPPDLKGRRAILDVHTRDKPLAEDVDLEMVARQTSGLTGADLANICNEAAIFAGREHREQLLTRDFQAALERVIAGMQSRRVITEHEKRVVAYHEAGHALCSELLPSVEKVHRISIIPRGKALGYTLNLPEEDRYLKTKDELLDYMVVLLGGRVTEHLVFGQVTTGASDDLRKVHEISRSMITQYGMGTELTSKQLPADDYSMSDHTRRMIDEEQQYLTDLAHRRAHADRGREPRRCSRRSPTPCSRTRCSSARTSSAWWRSTAAARRRRRRRARAARARARPATVAASERIEGQPGADSPRVAHTLWPRLSAAVFGRIDHIGVAVEDLDEAVALYSERLGMPRPAPRDGGGAGRGGRAARRRREPRRAAAAARPGHGGRQVPREERPRPAPRGLRDRRHRVAHRGRARRRARG